MPSKNAKKTTIDRKWLKKLGEFTNTPTSSTKCYRFWKNKSLWFIGSEWRKLHNPKVIKLVALVGIIAMQKWSAFDHWSKFDNLWFNVECIFSIISLCVEYHSFFLRWVIWNVGNGGKLRRSLQFTCFLNNNSMMKQYIFNFILNCRGFSWCIQSNRWFDSKHFSLHKMTNCEQAKNELWQQKSTVFIPIWYTQNAKNINFHLQIMCRIHKSP